MKWFNRQPKNRRLRNTHVLDVKLRSDQVRAGRMRLAAIALSFTFATIFGFYLLWRTTQYALDRLVYQNDAFAVQEIDVQTDGVIAPDQLRRWAGVKVGDNLMAMDLAKIKRDLEMASVIRSVALDRVLPHTLRIRVAEREATAQINVQVMNANGVSETAVRHVDVDGYVMSLLDPHLRLVPATQTNEVLPTICGLNQMEVQPGKRLESAQAHSALQLIAAFDRSPMAGLVDLQTIDVSSPEILQVKTSQGSEITFSLTDLDRQLRRWRQIYDQAQRFGKVAASLDFSVPNSIPARWSEASAVPAVVPRPRTIQHYRRKNV